MNGTYTEIKKNVVAMIFHKVGTIIRDSTDNLLISKYIGIITTGIYSNYAMITKIFTTLISQVFAAVLSSVRKFTRNKKSRSSKRSIL